MHEIPLKTPPRFDPSTSPDRVHRRMLLIVVLTGLAMFLVVLAAALGSPRDTIGASVCVPAQSIHSLPAPSASSGSALSAIWTAVENG